jgi:DNA-binding response OmpR family regulator
MKSILIVEDEKDIARVLQMRLKQEGYNTAFAMDGMSAVQVAHNSKPDLIILDLMIPGGDGLSVLKKIKMSVNTNMIPVIILSSMQNVEYRNKVMGERPDAFISKPYDAQELLAEIKRLIG